MQEAIDLRLLLDKQEEILLNQKKYEKLSRDIFAKLILRQIEISRQVRALSDRFNTIDYSINVIHEELIR